MKMRWPAGRDREWLYIRGKRGRAVNVESKWEADIPNLPSLKDLCGLSTLM